MNFLTDFLKPVNQSIDMKHVSLEGHNNANYDKPNEKRITYEDKTNIKQVKKNLNDKNYSV